jgi:hypothetical protein
VPHRGGGTIVLGPGREAPSPERRLTMTEDTTGIETDIVTISILT